MNRKPTKKQVLEQSRREAVAIYVDHLIDGESKFDAFQNADADNETSTDLMFSDVVSFGKVNKKATVQDLLAFTYAKLGITHKNYNDLVTGNAVVKNTGNVKTDYAIYLQQRFSTWKRIADSDLLSEIGKHGSPSALRRIDEKAKEKAKEDRKKAKEKAEQEEQTNAAERIVFHCDDLMDYFREIDAIVHTLKGKDRVHAIDRIASITADLATDYPPTLADEIAA